MSEILNELTKKHKLSGVEISAVRMMEKSGVSKAHIITALGLEGDRPQPKSADYAEMESSLLKCPLCNGLMNYADLASGRKVLYCKADRTCKPIPTED